MHVFSSSQCSGRKSIRPAQITGRDRSAAGGRSVADGPKAGAGGPARPRRLAYSLLVAGLLLLLLQGVSSAQTPVEPTATITTTTPEAVEGEEATFVVTRTGDTAGALTVSLEWEDLTAVTLGSNRPPTVEIPSGASSVDVTVPLRDNAEVGSSTAPVTATVAPGSGYVVGNPASATVSVVDDGDQRIEVILGPELTVFENIGSQQVTVPLRLRTTGTHRQAAPDNWGFSLSARSDTALSSSGDFTRFVHELLIAPADWTVVNGAWEWELPADDKYAVTVHNDAEAEPPEDFYFLMEGTAGHADLSQVVESGAGEVRHKVTIYDDDVQFVVDVAGVDDLSAVEGEEIVIRITGGSKWLHACRTSGSQNNIDDMRLIFYFNLLPDTADLGDDVTWSDGTTVLQKIDLNNLSAVEGDPTTACRVQETADLSLNTIDDEEVEGTESFAMRFVTFAPPPELPSEYLTGTIIDDDTAALSVAGASAPEDGGALTFTVTLSRAADETVTVDYATADGTATAGTDYTTTTGTLTFAPNETSKTVTVPVLDDSTDEPDETLTLTLSNPTNVAIATAAGTGTIIDDDEPPPVEPPPAELTVTIATTTPVAQEGDGALTFTVTLSRAADETVTVDYTTADTTATAGTDYTATSGTLTFAPNETSKTVTVPVLDDSTDEPDETLTLTLSNPTNVAIDTATATGTIIDDDTAALAIAGASAPEGDGALTFTVTLSGAADETVTVDYTTTDGTATAGTDYTATSGTLTFAPGETSKTITVPISDDSTDEDNETLTLTLSNASPTDVAIDTATATGTIIDDDTAALAIAGASAPEGDGALTFTVTLSGAADETVTVDYATTDGTATAGTDYTATSGTLTFAPGETSKTITVPISDDSTDEDNETLTLTLSNASPTDVAIDTATATGTIIDDDEPPPVELTVTIATTTQAQERDGELTFTVTLSRAADETVTVDYATTDGTATAGTDYTATTGTLTFAPGETSKTITVPISDDSTDEDNETLTLTLSNASPTNAEIGNAAATGTIIDDDEPPPVKPRPVKFTVRIATTTPVAQESDGALTFTVTLSRAADKTVTVDYTTADATATADTDYTTTTGTLTFAPGETSKTITVPIADDSTDEDNETLTLTLSNPTNARIANATATGTIIDDDTAALSIAGASAPEGDGALTFTVTLSPADEAVTVDYATADATATAGDDYTATTDTLTFAPGETSKTITVPIADDSTDEDNETLTLTLSNPTNAEIDTTTATGTIIDDDEPPPVEPPPVEPPPVIASLREQVMLHVGDEATLVDIGPAFTGIITSYGAGAGDVDIVEVSIEGSTVSLTGLAEGSTTISIHATNAAGSALQVFTVVVRDMATPVIGEFLAAITLTAGDAPTVLDVAAGFGGDIDSYDTLSSDTGIVTVTLAGSRLSFTGITPGATDVTVTATNTRGCALQTIRVMVLEKPTGPVADFPTG